MRSRLRLMTAAAGAALAVTTIGYGIEAARAEGERVAPLGPGNVTIRLSIEHSVFDHEEIQVVEGTRVRFVLDNGDPIGHELIVGPESVHARHQAGTHPSHPTIEGEVSVGPNAVSMTTYRFDDPGEVEFACHLPGHYAFGMHGTIVVVPAAER
jgi:uncharacterized cupredoxin-like copper-binding protein